MAWRIEFDKLKRVVFVENDKGIRKAIVMYSPSAREWADEIIPNLKNDGWEIEALNGGVEEEYERIREIEEILSRVLEVLL